MNEIEIKREKYKKYFTVGIIAVIGLAVAPFIFMAVGGIIGLAVAGALGSAVIAFAPLFSMKLANWKVKGIVDEAKTNPIETMTNLVMAKRVSFEVFKKDVESSVAGLSMFRQKTDTFTKQYPARAKEFQIQVANMEQLVNQKKSALSVARDAIVNADLKLEEMKAYWDMSQISQATHKSAGMSTGDRYEKLKLDTACDAVFDSVNTAFAQMEVASALSIENNPSKTLDQAVDVSYKITNSPVKVLVK